MVQRSKSRSCLAVETRHSRFSCHILIPYQKLISRRLSTPFNLSGSIPSPLGERICYCGIRLFFTIVIEREWHIYTYLR
jgi:hypothetical protein